MKITEAYQLQNSDYQALARYMQVLLSTKDLPSVSRPNPTSGVINKDFSNIGRGFLDKLILHLESRVKRDQIVERCSKLNYAVKGKWLPDKKFYLEIACHPFHIYCLLGREDAEDFYKIELSPANGESIHQINDLLVSIFGKSVLDSKNYRIDATVDIYKIYIKVLEGLDIENKRARSEFLDGSIRTGLIVGKGDDKFVLYDKARKEKVNKEWTRIERQLSGPKVFCKRFGDLSDNLKKLLEANLFKGIVLNHINLIEPPSLSNDQKEKFNEFKVLIKHEGFFLTRKKLNKNNNFYRDYGKFFTLIPYDVQPQDIFNNAMIDFFKEKNNGS